MTAQLADRLLTTGVLVEGRKPSRRRSIWQRLARALGFAR